MMQQVYDILHDKFDALIDYKEQIIFDGELLPWSAIGKELIEKEFLQYGKSIEKEIQLPYEQPLKLHGRYTREQILTAFGFSSFDKKASNREGVAENKKLNTELLFINLIKSEEDF